ncbi:MAG: hypothetical protein HYV09_25205 [Deltaproteobacteria bacterium]|nr:hypothetical protein [Deltaproteobacteria bacterium]
MPSDRKRPRRTNLDAPATSAVAAAEERRGSGERRDGEDRRRAPLDRRAFWRPTPDRRREATELGRRATDAGE